jgi:hypothetical protein
MFHFFKKKKIVLDCFTTVPAVYDNCKIDYGSKYYPEWWKDTPKVLNEFNTIKSCRAFIDYYKRGIVIPSWFEADVTLFERGNIENKWFTMKYSNDYVDLSQSHDSVQFLNFARDTGRNIKIKSPWAFKCNKDIGFSWTQPTWSMRDIFKHFSLLPSVMNFKYQHHTHINFYIQLEDSPVTVTIPPLTPLVMLHPLTEEKVEIKNHLVDEKEFHRIFSKEELLLHRNLDDESKEFQRKKALTHKLEEINQCPFKGKL